MRWALFLVAAALAGASYPKPATVTAADGVRLAASMAVPAKATRGVLLVHQDGRAKEDWDALAKVLFGNGYAVLALDLRTQGANAREGTPTTTADYAAMQTDVAAGIAHLKAQGVKTLSLVGAELGANLVVNAAISDPSVASLVLLSPGLEIRGIIGQRPTRESHGHRIRIVQLHPVAALAVGVLQHGGIRRHELAQDG